MFTDAVTLGDGVSFGLPTVGMSLGWILFVWLFMSLLAGKLHTDKAWLARERDHEREVLRMEAEHARELERVEHDRGEWRSESRIKDAQMAELNEQAAERNRQIRSLEPLGSTLEQVMQGLRDVVARGGEERS